MSRQPRHLPRSGDSRGWEQWQRGMLQGSCSCTWQKLKKHPSPEQHSKDFIWALLCPGRALIWFLPPLLHTLEPIIPKWVNVYRDTDGCVSCSAILILPLEASPLASAMSLPRFNASAAQECHKAMNCVFRVPSEQQFTVIRGFQVQNKITVNQGK